MGGKSLMLRGGAMATLAVALAAGGCATKTGKGAAYGAAGGSAVGAGIGALAGGGSGAAIGAAVGAGVGAGTGALVGRYMDKQQKELEENVENAQIERKGDQLEVKLNSAILFDTNEAELKPEAIADLAEFAGVLKEYEQTNLVIEGHTDSTGPENLNRRLSQERAESVVRFLESRGVDGSRLKSYGYGEAKPVGSNSTVEGRTQNRRVQIVIAPSEELKQQDAAAAKQAEEQQRAKAPQQGTTR